MTVMALNTNGMWETKQLTPQLQEIIKKHSTVFIAAQKTLQRRKLLHTHPKITKIQPIQNECHESLILQK